MASKYFKDKRYLASTKRTVDYLEKELISKADYFSSTLDANCEDKEASLYAATAAYCLIWLWLPKDETMRLALQKWRRKPLILRCRGIILGCSFCRRSDAGRYGLKPVVGEMCRSRITILMYFIFEFADVLHWLSKINEPRFSDFAEVISTSMRQLLPYEGHMCGIAKVGLYPEVVQHTISIRTQRKGILQQYLAPGLSTVASLWELFTPGRAEQFLLKKMIV